MKDKIISKLLSLLDRGNYQRHDFPIATVYLYNISGFPMIECMKIINNYDLFNRSYIINDDNYVQINRKWVQENE